MIKIISMIVAVLLLSGCSGVMQRSLDVVNNAGPARIQVSPNPNRLDAVPPLAEVGNETWFQVVERVGMDNLIKERQLIRNTRDVYEKESPNGPTPLKPMLFAGLILEGGIVGYDSNVAMGGAGARYLGLGMQTEYRVDTVTVVMRLVSVSNGKVLLSVATEKTIASYRSGADIFRFLDLGTKLVESETGYSVNEPVNYAVREAIEAGVIELIYEGNRKELWKFKGETR